MGKTVKGGSQQAGRRLSPCGRSVGQEVMLNVIMATIDLVSSDH